MTQWLVVPANGGGKMLTNMSLVNHPSNWRGQYFPGLMWGYYSFLNVKSINHDRWEMEAGWWCTLCNGSGTNVPAEGMVHEGTKILSHGSGACMKNAKSAINLSRALRILSWCTLWGVITFPLWPALTTYNPLLANNHFTLDIHLYRDDCTPRCNKIKQEFLNFLMPKEIPRKADKIRKE